MWFYIFFIFPHFLNNEINVIERKNKLPSCVFSLSFTPIFLLLFGLVQIIDVLHPGRPNVAKVGTLFISMRSWSAFAIVSISLFIGYLL